jgi:hypothetical protein
MFARENAHCCQKISLQRRETVLGVVKSERMKDDLASAKVRHSRKCWRQKEGVNFKSGNYFLEKSEICNRSGVYAPRVAYLRINFWK